MRATNKTVSVFLTTAFLFLLPSLASAQVVGFESEFATAGFMEPQWGDQQMQLSQKMLEIVQQRFNGQGELLTVPWTKYPEKNLQIKVYRDPRGKTWAVDPESVNTSGLDGVEFVTPTLDTPEYIDIYSSIMADFRKTKLLMRGLRSSNHITVDVSHLLMDPHNVSQLVDLILTIENHWADTYRFFDPVRYGTIINRFSVPLAIDQQDLLKELAAMPVSERTYTNVRNVFLKYDAKEGELRDPDNSNPVRKWKYRAANYGKLFRLAPDSKGVAAIEFRIGDLEFGSRVKEKAAFMQKLVKSDNLDKTFVSPFGDKVLTWKEGTVVLQKLPLQSEFLKNLVSDKTLMAIQNKMDLNPPNAGAADLLDMNRPVQKDGKFISFGFEAEFADGNRAQNIVDSDHAIQPKFPYLDSKVSTEGTGNLEVRSIGGERVLGEVLQQMQEVSSNLKENLRGFHMHMRIPKEIIAQHDPVVLKAWMTSISDAVFAWRLQNRKHFFALKTWSVARQEMERITARGPVRLQQLEDGTWDFEIRGYMNSFEMIGMMAQKVMTGLMDPTLIGTQVAEQRDLSKAKMDLEASLKKYAKTFYGRDMTAEELEVTERFASEVRGIGMLPLYDFANRFGYDPVLKRKIQDATMLFFKETFTVITNTLNNKYQSQEEAGKQFRWRIKRWAQQIDLQSLLEQEILMPARYDSDGNGILSRYGYDRNQLLDDKAFEKADKILNTKNASAQDQNQALLALAGRSDTQSTNLIMGALSATDAWLRRAASTILNTTSGPGSLALIRKALDDHDSSIRFQAAVALKGRTDADSLALVEIAMKDSEVDVRRSAVKALQNRNDTKSMELIKLAINDSDFLVRLDGFKALKGRNDVQILDFLEQLFSENTDEDIRASVMVALQGRADVRCLPLIKEALQGGPKLRIAAVMALQGRTDAQSIDLLMNAMNDSSPAASAEAFKVMQSSAIGDAAFMAIYTKDMSDPSKSDEFKTNLKRSYILRFGSLKATPNSAPLCRSVFL